MADHEIHGCVHECPIKVVEDLPTASEFPDANVLWCVLKDPEEYHAVLQGNHHLFGFDALERLPDKRNVKCPH
jgi:hypothetical protein